MKIYKLEIVLTDEDELKVNSTNDGFNPLEIIGMLDWKKRDIEKQMFGDIKPDNVSRKFIED